MEIGIHEQGTFSVNIPSADLMPETQICGSKSGRDFDKSSLFEAFYGETETAPMIRQCPINMECRVTEVLDYDLNEGIIGEVVGSYINPNCLSDGKLDLRKVDAFVWATGGDSSYYRVSERVS
ncbi:MAG: flavin reductase family protein [Candidatus Thorarchaeota archaeon]|jgi:flavin reductase (DIM6/NTAB) family NADH-FMN oxidoreductase RutF